VNPAREQQQASLSFLDRIQVGVLVVVAFVVPLLMWPGLTDYNYTKTIASLVAISGLLIVWAMHAWKHNEWTIRIPWPFLPAAGLILASLLSLLHAASGQLVVQSTVVLTWFASLALLTSNAIRHVRHARWILGALLASGIAAAIYGLLQYVGVLPGPAGTSGLNAIVSTLGNRNHLGGLLLYLFYPSAIFLIRGRRWWTKALTLLAMVLLLATMILVQQTAVRISLVFVTLALIVAGFIFPVRRTIRANRRWIGALAGILVVGAALVLVISQRTPHTTSGDETSWLAEQWASTSASARTWDWWIGVDMLQDHPVTGVGLGLYKVEFIASRADFLSTSRGQSYDKTFAHASQAHNEYVQAAAEMGIFGLVMVAATLATLAACLWRRMRRTRDAARLDLLLLTAGILAFLIHSVVSFPAHVVPSSLAMVLLCGLALSPTYGTGEAFTVRLRGAWPKIAMFAMTAAATAVAAFAVCDAHANALMERGIDEIQAGRYASGEVLLERSLRFDFAPRQTYYYLGIAQIQLGALDEAQTNLARCMTRFVDEAALLNYANLLVNTGQSEQAFEPLNLLLNSRPRSEIEPRARYLYALAVSETGDPGSGIEQIEDLLLDYPRFQTAYIGLGGIYASMDRWDEAREAYEEGLDVIASQEKSIRKRIEQLGDDITPEQTDSFSSDLRKLSADSSVFLERLEDISNSENP
jgi:O-antigen ligase/tetratricopeptide (TPR) repeat protein